jgi:ribosomal protein S18 acetylase RimI-like enzyme
MDTDVRVRHISDSDWGGIVALESSAYTAFALSEGRAALESRAHVSPATCFVLDLGRHVAGYVLALPYPMFRFPDLARTEEDVFPSRNLHLHDLVIAEDLRGRGLAGHLLRHLTATAGSQRYERISLVAVAGSAGFWAANGYRPHNEVTLPASYGTNAVYMSKAVPEDDKGDAHVSRSR